MSWWLDLGDLDNDQKDVIALPPEGNYLIMGPPGSGKTNLLLIRAEYLIRAGRPNVFLLMFNDSLHDFVVRGGTHYDLPPSKIRKMLSWEISLLRENGIDVEDISEQELPEKRKALAEKVLSMINRNPQLEKHIQCLFVDEVQDCLPEELAVFTRCAENVCLAGDNRQRIFSAKSIIPDFTRNLTTIELKTHYRIGHEICRAADVIGRSAGLDAIEEDCNYKDAASKAQFVNCIDDEEQAKRIIDTLKIQLTAYPDELLAIAAPRKQDRDFLRSQLEDSALSPFVLPHRRSGGTPLQRIYIAHLTEIKGLEFRTIHLGLMQHLHRLGENQKRIAYTAITRAKTTVSIYFSGRIPGYLEQAQAEIEPPKPKPSLVDLFPKKKGKD
jgi:superfamily I DNA/RNA helicase